MARTIWVNIDEGSEEDQKHNVLAKLYAHILLWINFRVRKTF